MAVDEKLLARHDDQIESLVEKFDQQLSTIVSQSRLQLWVELLGQLDVSGGKIVQSPKNRTVLRRVDKLFLALLRKRGLTQLVDAFVGTFGEQFKFFNQVLASTLKQSDLSTTTFRLGAEEKRYLVLQQADVATRLEELITEKATALRENVLLSLGALTPKRLAEILVERADKTPDAAKSLAATAISTFYRTIANLQFKQIEEDDVRDEIRYRYAGPPAGDPVIRPFCKNLMSHSEKTYTRAQVEAMDNGQGTGVFEAGGGYNCRHQWLLVIIKRSK